MAADVVVPPATHRAQLRAGSLCPDLVEPWRKGILLTTSVAPVAARRTLRGRWTALAGVLVALLLTLHCVGDAEAAAVHPGDALSAQQVETVTTDQAPHQAYPICDTTGGHTVTAGCGILIAASANPAPGRALGTVAVVVLSLLVLAFRIPSAVPAPSGTTRLRLCVARV